MPLATATITGVSHKLGTSIARPGVVRATYLGGAYIDDDAANTLISGVAEATVQADGSFSLVLPAGFVYSFTFTGEDSDPGWTVGPAQVDASAALDDLVLVTAPDDTKSTYQHITGLTGAATWNITYDSLVVECTLTGDATVTLTQTGEPNYRIVRIIPTLAGHTLTVAGIAIAGATTLEHLTSGWVTAGGGGGGGGDPIEVAAQAPVFDDSALTITIPAVAGVVYSLDGNAAASGDYPADAGTTYTVTAEAEAGYVLTVGLPDTWTHDFPAAEAWVQAFADTLLAPVGEITVRAGWAVTNANAGYDHVTTDATSTYATGLGAMRVENTPALKHALECDYDLSDGDTYSQVNFTVSASWGSHKILVGRANAGAAHATISALSTAGWADFAAEPGVDLAAQPLAGHARVECDGVRIYVYLNGVLIAGGLRDAANNPSWAGAATGSSLAFSGRPNYARKTRVKNVKLETKA